MTGYTRLSYFVRVPNVGDLINPIIVSKVLGRDCVWSTNRKPHVLAIGSRMAAATETSFIWGTGVMDPLIGIGRPRPSQIFALRGKLTVGAMRATGLKVPDVPLGDPGYLVRSLLDTNSASGETERIGVVAHYADRDHPWVSAVLKRENVVDLDVREPAMNFLNRMRGCSVIVSSSLHGLVFAESLGIPNVWIQLSQQVAGSGFKFHDWFSLAKRPQLVPFTSNTDFAKVVGQADIHEMDIDCRAIIDAFPDGEVTRSAQVEVRQAVKGLKSGIPIFILSFNRGDMLRNNVDIYRQKCPDSDIVIHDFGSDDSATKIDLEFLESTGCTVYRDVKITSADELERVNTSIDAYFSMKLEPTPYVVTDCDIDLGKCDDDFLAIFNDLLSRFTEIDCVGPMLTIVDIPQTYPLIDHALNRHVEQFWHKKPERTMSLGKPVAYQRASIDTTFAVHRAGTSFKRKREGLRIYSPYEARHLDWYKTVADIEGTKYSKSASSGISHWATLNAVFKNGDELREYQRCIIIERMSDGSLRNVEFDLETMSPISYEVDKTVKEIWEEDCDVGEVSVETRENSMDDSQPEHFSGHEDRQAKSAGAKRQVVAPSSAVTIVSAYGGDRYYYDCAEALAEDCERLGLKHDFVEWNVAPGEAWISICRRKISFYLEMIKRHPHGILWLDIDSRIHKFPKEINDLSCDMAGFVRSFKYIRDFDPTLFTRFLMPFAVFFSGSKESIQFLELMSKLEQESDVIATDDYFLQEAWLQHDNQLSITILPPKIVQRHTEPRNDDHCFVFGHSGSAKPASQVAMQHGRPEVDSGQRIRVLRALAAEAGDRKSTDEQIMYLKELLRTRPVDQEAAGMLIRQSRHPSRIEAGREVLASLERFWRPPYTALRSWFFTEFEANHFDRAREICDRLAKSENQTDRDYAKAKYYRLALEERAAALGVLKKNRPKVWWMETPYPGNLGDIVNPYIVEKLTGLPPLLSPAAKGNLVIGSVIKFAKAGTKVWGTGTPRMTDVLDPAADYRAVRGPLTRELVMSSGGKCPEIYGDVAWFLPKLYNPRIAKTHKLGLIRHLNHMNRDISVDGVREISLSRIGDQEIEAFIDELLSCEKIISTSLHGIIIAHAYGIPAEWANFDDNGTELQGDGTKFWDYFASVGIEKHDPMDLASLQTISVSLADSVTRLPVRQIDLAELVRVAPYKILPNWERIGG